MAGIPVQMGTLTIRGTITTSGQALEHAQYLSPEFVVTELGRVTIVYSLELGGRFVVDFGARRLHRVDPAAQAVQVAHLKKLVGEVCTHRDSEPTELDGFSCRRYRLCNDSDRIAVSAEAYCTRISAIGGTALQEERAFEARLHPFVLPLERDELVIRCSTRTYSNGFQHVQTYRHGSLEDGIERLAAFEEYLRFPLSGH